MRPAVLIVGAGPYGTALAEEFTNSGYSVIISTIDESKISELRQLGYFPIYTQNLHEDNCKIIFGNSMELLHNNALELKYIIYTARFAFYEFDELDPPEEIKVEMKIVNSESPLTLAKLFLQTGSQFVFTSSAATKGFDNSLEKKATPSVHNKKIGTRGLKYYSYTKRIGEEQLYAFFKEIKRSDLLSIIYITLMHKTNFFKDIDVTNPQGKGLDANEIASYVVKDVLKGKRLIYPGFEVKLLSILPLSLRRKILDTAERLYPLK